MWTCPKCGVRVDPNYHTCWSCGTERDSTAAPIVARADEIRSGEWECPKCRERVEAAFDVCWSCGTTRDGTEDPTFAPADDADLIDASPHPDDSPPREPIRCLRCQGEMEEGFVADYRDHVFRWFAGRPEQSIWTGLQSDAEPIVVRTYRCVRCGYLESFAAPEQ